jgi:hypothetical protein
MQSRGNQRKKIIDQDSCIDHWEVWADQDCPFDCAGIFLIYCCTLFLQAKQALYKIQPFSVLTYGSNQCIILRLRRALRRFTFFKTTLASSDARRAAR